VRRWIEAILRRTVCLAKHRHRTHILKSDLLSIFAIMGVADQAAAASAAAMAQAYGGGPMKTDSAGEEGLPHVAAYQAAVEMLERERGCASPVLDFLRFARAITNMANDQNLTKFAGDHFLSVSTESLLFEWEAVVLLGAIVERTAVWLLHVACLRAQRAGRLTVGGSDIDVANSLVAFPS
jgi:histone H3/H4